MKRNLLSIITIAVFITSLMFSCNDQQNNDNYNDNNEEDEEEVEENTKLDEMDNKMREIMDENQDDGSEPSKEVRIVKADGAKSVKVKIHIGAGQLKLSGGSSELLLAGFKYSISSMKPIIEYKVDASKGQLLVMQPDNNEINFDNDDKYIWNLKFCNNIPLDLEINVGAGLSEIELGDLNVDNFTMDMGVGKTEIDLRGDWKKNTSINLNGGIGLSRIIVPQNVGVKLIVNKGIGSVDFKGLTQKSSNVYVNKLYESSKITLTINLKTGIGQIEIE